MKSPYTHHEMSIHIMKSAFSFTDIDKYILLVPVMLACMQVFGMHGFIHGSSNFGSYNHAF